jgi:DNA-binding winged helix-turn-helix (wHTH) protein/TolB-like protein/tetratricopeptide (TPR) repeat protein
MSNLYEFGPFRLDLQEQRLLSEGKPVPLTPKSFELLRVLVENPGRLLPKDELLKLVWPDSYVEEGNLSHHVFALRKALGDEKLSAQYIETVPRRGYRFIADVQELKKTVAREAPVVREPFADQCRAIERGSAPVTDAAPQISRVSVHHRRWPLGATASALAILLTMTVIGVVGYRWRVGSVHNAASSTRRQIAVLPFKPIVVTDRDESLEWGMAETLITRLGGVSEIGVRPFSAVRRYGSLDQDPAAAGRELGVEAVLDGSLQRVGGRIRVTARLIRTIDGEPMWVRTFDENVSDIFALQDSISEQVVGSLIPEWIAQARSRFGMRGTDNPDAYQLYLRGRFFWNKRTKESLKNAIDYFGRALAKDPEYALAYSGIADCYIIRHDLPPHDRMPKARDAAAKALQINPNLGEAHLSLARVKGYYEWDRAGAERELRKAIAIDPRSADAYRTLALHLMWVHRFDEAEDANRRAQDLDPLSVTVNKQAASLAFHRRQYDKAIALYRSVLELDPRFPQAQREIGLAFLQTRQYQEAQQALRTSLEQPENYFKSTNASDLAHAYAVAGDRREALGILATLQRSPSDDYVDPADVAVVYVGLGDKESALEWLRRASDEHSYWLSWLGVDPRWDPLRVDFRFREVEQRVGVGPK